MLAGYQAFKAYLPKSYVEEKIGIGLERSMIRSTAQAMRPGDRIRISYLDADKNISQLKDKIAKGEAELRAGGASSARVSLIHEVIADYRQRITNLERRVFKFHEASRYMSDFHDSRDALAFMEDLSKRQGKIESGYFWQRSGLAKISRFSRNDFIALAVALSVFGIVATEESIAGRISCMRDAELDRSIH